MIGAGILAPVPSAEAVSWVWQLVAIGLVLAVLAVTWWAHLWGRAAEVMRGEAKTHSLTTRTDRKAA